MSLKGSIAAIFLAALWSASPAVAETLTLRVEKGSITGVTDTQTGQLVLYISNESSRDLADFTHRHTGATLDILIGDEVMASPTIHEPIYGPQIPILRPMAEAKQRDIIKKLVEGDVALQLRTRDR